MTPADCAAIVFVAGLLLFVGYRCLAWWARTTIEDYIKGAPEPIYQPRCSTTPAPDRLAIWLAFGVITLAVVEIALLIARAFWCG